MPMDRSLYPPNWDAIALSKKQAVNWTCENCGRPCRRSGQGEAEAEFEMRLEAEHPLWYPDLFAEVADEELGFVEVKKLTRFVLTVAHKNQNPSDCSDENLKAWCAPCHLDYDRPHRVANRYRKRERGGQLTLLWPPAIAPTPAGQGKSPHHIQPPLWS